nr:unnamed protein product [Callosobruchus analis]
MNKKKKPKHSNSIESRNISEISPDTDIQVEKVLEENEQLKELLEEKEKLIYQLTNENLRLQEQCNLITSNIIEKDSVVSMLDRISARLNEAEKNQTVKGTSFAEILKQRPTNVTQNDPLKSIIITPNQNQSCEETRQDLSKKNSLSKLKIQINDIQNSKNGGLEIKLSDNHHKTLKNIVEEKLSTNYKVTEPKMFRPRNKIVNFKSKEKPNENNNVYMSTKTMRCRNARNVFASTIRRRSAEIRRHV